MKSVIKSLLLVVGIPTFIAIVYYSFFASDIYVSEAKFAIRSSKSSVSVSGVASLFASGDSSGAGQDSVVVQNYIHSGDMIKLLEEKLNLVDNYSKQEIDFVARLKKNPTREDVLEYMTDNIEIVRDESSNIISLKVKAFTSSLANAIAHEIINLSEGLVNRLSSRIEKDTLEIAHLEVDLAASKVFEASEKLSSLRDSTTSIDPSAESNAVLGIVSGIESKLTESRAELSEKRAYMRENSSDVKTALNRVKALEEQLLLERHRLAGNQGETMSGLIQRYQPLILEQEMAREQYTSALVSLEAARIEANRKKQYLITFILPTLPDEALEPQRLMSILSVSMFAFLFYSVGGLMWAALKDHIGR